jgi:hypothetical protein
VNKQDFRFWAPHNPQELHERPLHSLKVTVWCALSSSVIIGPYFFEGDVGRVVTVSAEWYEVVL